MLGDTGYAYGLSTRLPRREVTATSVKVTSKLRCAEMPARRAQHPGLCSWQRGGVDGQSKFLAECEEAEPPQPGTSPGIGSVVNRIKITY